MTCISELNGMRYCDEDLTRDEHDHVSVHLSRCAPCRALVARLARENDALRDAIAASLPEARSPRSAISGLAMVLAVTVAARWMILGQAEWSLVATIPTAVATVMRLIAFVGYPVAFAVSLLGIVVALAAVTGRRPSVAVMTVTLLLLGSPLFAQTRLVGQREAVVAAGEVVQGDVLASGQVVHIEGTIRGNLYAAASRIDITGTVTGRVVAIAESVRVSGQVRSLIAIAKIHTLEGRVASWRAWGEEIRMMPGAESSGGVVTMGRVASLHGLLQGGTRVYGQTLSLGPTARLAGLVARLSDRSGLHLAAGAVISGRRDIRAGPRSRWSAEALTLQAAAATVTYGVGLWLWYRRRRFLELSARRVSAWWPSLYRGVARVIVVATTTVALAVTLIGLPLALMGVALLTAALVLGKAIVATFVAEHLGWRDREFAFVVRFLVALLILAVLSLPGWGIGATLSALMSIVGIGAAVRASPRRAASTP